MAKQQGPVVNTWNALPPLPLHLKGEFVIRPMAGHDDSNASQKKDTRTHLVGERREMKRKRPLSDEPSGNNGQPLLSGKERGIDSSSRRYGTRSRLGKPSSRSRLKGKRWGSGKIWATASVIGILLSAPFGEAQTPSVLSGTQYTGGSLSTKFSYDHEPVTAPWPAPQPSMDDDGKYASPVLSPKETVDRISWSDASSLEDLQSYRKLQTEQQCTLAMAVRDSNRDDQLSQDEYVNFLNQLFGNPYLNVPFQSLPCELQAKFTEYADGGSTIDVEGTKPGQSPSAEQAARISAMCTEVIAIYESNPASGPCGDTAGEAPVAAPAPVSGGGGGGGEVDCTGTIERAQCNTALAIADLSRDDQMDSTEYVRFVNRLSSNAYQGSSFSELPGNIQGVFDKFASNSVIDITGSKPGQTPTAAQDELIGALCCETDLAIANPGQPVAAPTRPPSDSPGDGPDCTGTIPQAQCNTALSIADTSRDDLMSEAEYVRFVNRLSNNQYIGVAYAALPSGLQSNYEKFAVTNGQVDVTGSKPGQTPTQAQADFLASLCCETDLAIDNPGDTGGTPTEPSPSPPTASSPPTYLPLVCRTAMASSDFNRDDNLNEDEYVRFLNRLTQNQFQGVAFTSLSEPLQNNFASNAQGGQINIFGSKPGQTATSAQSEFLDEFCVDTAIAIQAGGSGGPQPTSPPAGGGTPTNPPGGAPTFTDALCRTAMASSDSNRDDYLNQDEYVRFLNRLTQNQFEDDTYATLQPPLPQTYEKLADDTGQIWIFGSKPGQDATDEQEAFLIEICQEVSAALDQLGGTIAPAQSPSTGPPGPSLPPGVVEVFNSFIIANNRGVLAADLESGANRDGLNTAYTEFTKQSVETLAQARRTLQQLRSRRLAVTYIDGGDDIYLLLDDECPEGSGESETCQTAFAKFQVKVDDEDPNQVSSDFSAATQQAIADGDLQAALEVADPRSILRIVDASFPVTTTFPPTPAPDETQPPVKPPTNGGGDDKKDDGGGGKAGAIVGGIFGGIFACAAIGWLSTKFGGRKKTGVDDDDDNMGGKDDDASDGEKENAFGFGGNKDDDGSFGNDKPEQNPQDTKNVFGFGKKNKADKDDDNAFGADTGNNNTFGNEGDDNLELFAFDDPSVVRGGQDGQDGGSVAGKDNAFGANAPAWGNAANGSGGFFGNDGGGWGAPGADTGGADNFFGASAFGDAEPKENNSASGSESGSEEGSYTSSEDSTYESGNPDGEEGEGDEEGSGSYSRSSADEGSSYESGSMNSGLKRKSEQLDGMIDDGNWDGIAAAANSFGEEGSSLEGSSKRSSLKDKSLASSEGEDEDSFSGSGSQSGSGSASASGTSATTTSDVREKRAEYHAQVDALVRLVLPDEVEKVDAMMEQFKGREAELVSTLQTMQERTATQRARAAVHKSKNRPQRGEDGAFGLTSGVAGVPEGSAAGTAAIAAASLAIPPGGFEGEGDFDAFGGGGMQEPEEEGSFYDDEEGSRSHSGSGSRSGSRSYYSGAEEGSRSHSGSGSRSHSGSGSRSGSRSYYSEEGSRSRYSGEGSQVSGSQGSRSHTGSRSGSRSGSGSRSHYSGEDRSRSGSGSRSRSHYSGEGSQGSRSRSQYSGEEGSQGSRSRSQYSGEEGSQGSRSRSQYSGEEGSQGSRSRSQYSGEEGSQGSRSRSQYSGEEGSQGSRSYYSGEEGSQEGSRSYYSGEDDEGEGSFGEE